MAAVVSHTLSLSLLFLCPPPRPPPSGKFPGSVEEMLAFVSYLPLCGDGGSRGDGIIPLDVATLEGSTVVELPTSKHSGWWCVCFLSVNFEVALTWQKPMRDVGGERERESGAGDKLVFNDLFSLDCVFARVVANPSQVR